MFIPLSAGGDELIELSRGISEVQGEFLKIKIPVWLAAVLRIEEGDLVCVRKAGGLIRVGLSDSRVALSEAVCAETLRSARTTKRKADSSLRSE